MSRIFGIKQGDDFDKFMIGKIRKLYEEYIKDKGKLNFINWLMMEKGFYLFGRYIGHEDLKDIDFFVDPTS